MRIVALLLIILSVLAVLAGVCVISNGDTLDIVLGLVIVCYNIWNIRRLIWVYDNC